MYFIYKQPNGCYNNYEVSMDNYIKIYEAYLKPREKEYKTSEIESKTTLKEISLKNSLSLEQRKIFEEYLFLSKQLEHENNENLIKFVLEFINKQDS